MIDMDSPVVFWLGVIFMTVPSIYTELSVDFVLSILFGFPPTAASEKVPTHIDDRDAAKFKEKKRLHYTNYCQIANFHKLFACTEQLEDFASKTEKIVTKPAQRLSKEEEEHKATVQEMLLSLDLRTRAINGSFVEQMEGATERFKTNVAHCQSEKEWGFRFENWKFLCYYYIYHAIYKWKCFWLFRKLDSRVKKAVRAKERMEREMNVVTIFGISFGRLSKKWEDRLEDAILQLVILSKQT